MAENQDSKSNRTKQTALLSEDRPQPHSLETERAVLAAMLRDPKFCVGISIEIFGGKKTKKIKKNKFDEDSGIEDVFYSPVHRDLYRTILKLYDDDVKIDILSLGHQLKLQKKFDDIGGDIFLFDLYNTIATTANIETWCKIVREHAMLRRTIIACSETVAKCYDKDLKPIELIEDLEKQIYEIHANNSKSEIVEMKSVVENTFINIKAIIDKKVSPGIPSGLSDLDRLVVGFKPGEMFVLAARPSIGKTALALNIIRNVALRGEHKRSVAFFSLEMTTEQITRRLLCTEAQISESCFFDNSFKSTDINKLTTAVSAFQNSSIFLDETGALTISELRAKARRLKSQNKIELIVIDYLQLMRADNKKTDNRQEEVALISSGIKSLAKELKIPILVLAQLNRESEKTSGAASAHPKLSHLRESGSIEQDADIVTFLHRDRDKTKENNREANRAGSEAILIVEKNRNGRTGLVDLVFYPDRLEFCCKARYDESDRPGNAR
jgi:replicative DNA helicase